MVILPMNIEILPPSDDRVFKLLLVSPEAKPALMDLISALINIPITDVVIRNNELPLEHTQEKAERLDLNCVTDDGTQIDIEMQASHIREPVKGHTNLKGKCMYYLCDLHSSQSSAGKSYDQLAKTYQITFCMYSVLEHKEFINSYSMRHDTKNELLCDAIHMIFVELSKLDDVLKKPVKEMTDIEKWAVFFRCADRPEYRNIANEVINTKEVLQMAGTLLTGISKDERERAIFRSRRMYQSDMESNLITARREGLIEGRVEGLIEGRIEVARKLKEAGIMSVEEIAQYTGCSVVEIEELQGS